MICKMKLPPAILQMVRKANLQMLILLQICRLARVRLAGKHHPRIIAFCRNTPLLTGVMSTADELTSFVYSALLLGCDVSVAEDNRGI
jgi:hypothetical protein